MYQLPQLRFAADALEPWIAKDVLWRHHELHHLAYVARLNAVLERYPELQGRTIEELLRMLPAQSAEIRAELEDVAGGHANHQFQLKVIGPAGGGEPAGALGEAMERSFGSFAAFRERFMAAAMAQVGSGWAFLSVPKLGEKTLEILVLANNGSVLPIGKPGVLICDLWEHAYETQYPASREAYLDAFFHVVDWGVCGERFESFAAGRMHVG
jgi:Fe-Mn family superoxide dismutase